MKYKLLPVFDIKSCSGCRACTSYCVSGSLNIVDGVVTFQNPEGCLSDEFCVRECPTGGIHMEWLPVSNDVYRGKVLDQKPQMHKSA